MSNFEKEVQAWHTGFRCAIEKIESKLKDHQKMDDEMGEIFRSMKSFFLVDRNGQTEVDFAYKSTPAAQSEQIPRTVPRHDRRLPCGSCKHAATTPEGQHICFQQNIVKDASTRTLESALAMTVWMFYCNDDWYEAKS